MLDGRVGGVGVCEGRGETPDWLTVRAGKQQTTWRPARASCLILGFYMISLSSYCHLIHTTNYYTKQIFVWGKLPDR